MTIKKIVTSSITGNAVTNFANLTGISGISLNTQPYHIKRLKRVIFDRFINPMMQNDWSKLEENYITIDPLLTRVEKYSREYNNNQDLVMYAELLRLVLDMFTKHKYYKEIDANYNSQDSIAKVTAMLPAIRLKPEYEVYNLILGVPGKNENYDDFKLSQIGKLLTDEGMTLSEIEKIIK